MISIPDIFIYDLNKDDIDFFILGCDGIFDQLSSDEVINCAWMIYNNKDNILVSQCKDIHKQSGLITDLIMKSALFRKSLDNVTCLFISFKEIGNDIFKNNINDTDSQMVLSSKNKENYNHNINKNKIQYNKKINRIETGDKSEIKNDNNNKNNYTNDKQLSSKYNIKTNNEKISIRKSYLMNKRSTKSNEIKNDETPNTRQSIKSNNINENFINKKDENNTRRSYYNSNNNYK